MRPPPPLPYERQYAAIGRLIATWSVFVENIEQAIDMLERNEIVGARASPDRKVMQRFNYFMGLAKETTLCKEYGRLLKSQHQIIKIKRLRDALAHGSVTCWTEEFPLPEIMAFNIERGEKVRYTSDPAEIQRHCQLLSQSAIDLYLIARQTTFGF